MTRFFAAAVLTLSLASAQAADREPYGIGLEGFPYPYPVNLLPSCPGVSRASTSSLN